MTIGVRGKPLCEHCDQGGVVRRIVYGLPSPEAMNDRNRDYVFGGCCVGPDSPEWMCETCGRTYHFERGWRQPELEVDK